MIDPDAYKAVLRERNQNAYHALGVLGYLFEADDIPEPLRSSVEKIIERYQELNAQLDTLEAEDVA